MVKACLTVPSPVWAGWILAYLPGLGTDQEVWGRGGALYLTSGPKWPLHDPEHVFRSELFWCKVHELLGCARCVPDAESGRRASKVLTVLSQHLNDLCLWVS